MRLFLLTLLAAPSISFAAQGVNVDTESVDSPPQSFSEITVGMPARLTESSLKFTDYDAKTRTISVSATDTMSYVCKVEVTNMDQADVSTNGKLDFRLTSQKTWAVSSISAKTPQKVVLESQDFPGHQIVVSTDANLGFQARNTEIIRRCMNGLFTLPKIQRGVKTWHSAELLPTDGASAR